MSWWLKAKALVEEQKRQRKLRELIEKNNQLRAQDIPEWQKPAPLNTIVELGFPDTFIPPKSTTNPSIPIFDPALKQFARAFRNGDPVFEDPQHQLLWRAARRSAMDHVLRCIALNALGSRLALRGSRLMLEWFAERAREPGDLDFVAPRMWNIDVQGVELRDAITAQCREHAKISDGLELTGDAKFALLWTYERVPGYRLVFPWRATIEDAAVPSLEGAVQIDVVFGEDMFEAPRLLALGDNLQCLCVSPALSLAWKLLWLLDDSYPQFKDLYDALLLARVAPLDVALFAKVIQAADSGVRSRSVVDALAGLDNKEIWERCQDGAGLVIFEDEFGPMSHWSTLLRDALRTDIS
jgi:hypothetical protein